MSFGKKTVLAAATCFSIAFLHILISFAAGVTKKEVEFFLVSCFNVLRYHGPLVFVLLGVAFLLMGFCWIMVACKEYEGGMSDHYF